MEQMNIEPQRQLSNWRRYLPYWIILIIGGGTTAFYIFEVVVCDGSYCGFGLVFVVMAAFLTFGALLLTAIIQSAMRSYRKKRGAARIYSLLFMIAAIIVVLLIIDNLIFGGAFLDKILGRPPSYLR